MARNKGSTSSTSVEDSLVLTKTVKRNVQALEAAIHSSPAVLVEGVPGVGKTALIGHLAKKHGIDPITVNIDDSFDAKDLLGNYICSDTPGSYVMQEGPLTHGVRTGRWVVIEDIDLASFDLMSVLIPLIDTLILTVQDKEISMAPGFKLIATQTLNSGGASSINRTKVLSSFNMWSQTVIYPLSLAEMAYVVHHLQPSIPLHFVNSFLTSLYDLASTHVKFRLALRDVLRWGKRVGRARLVFNEKGYIPHNTRTALFSETVDCFCNHLPRKEYEELALKLAGKLEVSPDAQHYFLNLRRPNFQLTEQAVECGRAVVARRSTERPRENLFAPTKACLTLMESIMLAIQHTEPLLLTGETGIGKTFMVQAVSRMVGAELIVLNLNQQSGSSDFMGGYKPLDIALMVRPLLAEWRRLFASVFSVDKNAHVIEAAEGHRSERRWGHLVTLFENSVATATKKLKAKQEAKLNNPEPKDEPEAAGKKKKKKGKDKSKNKDKEEPEVSLEVQLEHWQNLARDVAEFDSKQKAAAASFIFQFFEGALVECWREGKWMLLDEINLASSNTLERLSAALEVQRGVLHLSERGDTEAIPMHPEFRLFACMNPPNDVGKKDLPPALRSRFTEIMVPEALDRSDVAIVVQHYIANLTVNLPVDDIVDFYLEAIAASHSILSDGNPSNPKPQYTLRTLSAALNFTKLAMPMFGFQAALLEGIRMAFSTQISRKFYPALEKLIMKYIVKRPNAQHITIPKQPSDNHINFEHIWLEKGPIEAFDNPGYVLTPSVKGHLTNLARIVLAKRPVLLQGPTSAGKTSMVEYLAQRTGHRFVRINNHHNTDLQEYFGTYISDKKGKLYFQEGILVEACRNGYWIVLDELNLAPSEILEALNRLLDDNRELVIPETQAVIKPHPHFHLFATQNPPMLYAGRKVLSRAFRNRFGELQVDDIPSEELETILVQRYRLPKTWVLKMIKIMHQLQIARQNSQLFAGKHGFITPRDLFKWASRKPGYIEELANYGFMLLGERCRKPEERALVKTTIEKACGVEINDEKLYDCFKNDAFAGLLSRLEEISAKDTSINGIVWTKSMKRLFTLIAYSMHFKEPFVLVGDTGGGKTTICQLYAYLAQCELSIINCHQHTETSDFLGSLRPTPAEMASKGRLFQWNDGPLVTAMKEGHHFLLDEISLAEDSVLERLNSVFETSRSLTLPEKGSKKIEEMFGHENFRIMATMNPGGDFGKKELSPALRNRMTEIYVPSSMAVEEDLRVILESRLKAQAKFTPVLMKFIAYFTQMESKGKRPLSVRDVIGWIEFIHRGIDVGLAPEQSVVQGCLCVILGGIGIGTGTSEAAAAEIQRSCLAKLVAILKEAKYPITMESIGKHFWEISNAKEPSLPPALAKHYTFECATTKDNLSKIVRAMTLTKPLLLEGSPGVGKTTLIQALGAAYGKTVVRINLSEQTDMMDLLGAYLPDHSGDSDTPKFTWSDGLLLKAIQEGYWVILDELNLASQSVLEGLNSILDHRRELFIPETGMRVTPSEGFWIFGAQNPISQGGGRKGLPRSFLNRFSRVHVDAFSSEDLYQITTQVHPKIPSDLVKKMIKFNNRLHQKVMVERAFGLQGSPFEFNLREIIRWCTLIQTNQAPSGPDAINPKEYLDVLYFQRMREPLDREKVAELFEEVFGTHHKADPNPVLYSTGPSTLRIGGFEYTTKKESKDADSKNRVALMLPCQTRPLLNILRCIKMNSMVLLIGPSDSGKTRLLEIAAALTGNTLRKMPMTAGCDTVELLGGFEQMEGQRGKFGWRDSVLIQAMEAGHWLAMENVNFCNPTVLDRLNPLLEPNGNLELNERGMVDGALRVVNPHPDFRLFLTMDPRHGSISRAMRNRGVEIALTHLEIPSPDAHVLVGSELHQLQSKSTTQGPSTILPVPASPTDPIVKRLGYKFVERLIEWHSIFVQVFHRPASREETTQDTKEVSQKHVFGVHTAALLVTSIPPPGIRQLLNMMRLFIALLEGSATIEHEDKKSKKDSKDQEQDDEDVWTAVSYIDAQEGRLPKGLDPAVVAKGSGKKDKAEAELFQKSLVHSIDQVYVRNRLLTPAQQRHAWLVFDTVFGPRPVIKEEDKDDAEMDVDKSTSQPTKQTANFSLEASPKAIHTTYALVRPYHETILASNVLRRCSLTATLCKAQAEDPLRLSLLYILYTSPLDPLLNNGEDVYLVQRKKWLTKALEECQQQNHSTAARHIEQTLASLDVLFNANGSSSVLLNSLRTLRTSAQASSMDPATADEMWGRWRLLLDMLPFGPLNLRPYCGGDDDTKDFKEAERWKELGPIMSALYQSVVIAFNIDPSVLGVAKLRKLTECAVTLCQSLGPLDTGSKKEKKSMGDGRVLAHVFGPNTSNTHQVRFLIHWKTLTKLIQPILDQYSAPEASSLHKKLLAMTETFDQLVHAHFRITQNAKSLLWKFNHPQAATSEDELMALDKLPTVAIHTMPTEEENEEEEETKEVVPVGAAKSILLPLFNVKSKADELALIGQVTRLAVNILMHQSLDPSTIHNLLVDVRAFHGFASTHSLHIDLGTKAYNQVSTILQNMQDITPIGKEDVQSLHSILHSGWLGWHERCWSGETSSRGQGSVLKGSALQGGVAGKLSTMFTQLQNSASVECIPPASGQAPIDSKLGALVGYLVEYKTPDVHGADWEYLLATWHLTLHPFLVSLPNAVKNTLFPMLHHLTQILTATDGPLLKEDEVGPLRDTLRQTLARVTDPRFQQTLDSHCMRLLDALLMAQKLHKVLELEEDVAAIADLLQRAIRGRAWAVLGEWRLLLLMPANPVDPILKNAEKLRVAQHTTSHLQATVSIFETSDSFMRGTKSSSTSSAPDQMHAWTAEADGEEGIVVHTHKKLLGAAKVSLETCQTKVIHRYSNPKTSNQFNFVTLYNELHRFITTHINTGKASKLSQELIDACFGEASAPQVPEQSPVEKRSRRGGKGKKKQKGQAGNAVEKDVEPDAVEVHTQLKTSAMMQGEEMWQDTATHLQSRLCGHYAGYEDIVIPTSAAIHHIRYGLRQLTSAYHAHSLLKNGMSLTQGDPSRAALAILSQAVPYLLAFPFTNTSMIDNVLKATAKLVPTDGASLEEDNLPQISLLMKVLQAVLTRAGHVLSLQNYYPTPDLLLTLRRVFSSYAQLWAVIGEKAEILHAAGEQVFKYKTKTTTFEEDDDMYYRRLREMFPNYKDAFGEDGAAQAPGAKPEDSKIGPGGGLGEADKGFEKKLLELKARLLGELRDIFNVYEATYQRCHARWLLGSTAEEGHEWAAEPSAKKKSGRGTTSHVHYQPFLGSAVARLGVDPQEDVTATRKVAFENSFVAGSLVAKGLEKGDATHALEDIEGGAQISGSGLGLLLPSTAPVEESVIPSFLMSSINLYGTLVRPIDRSNAIADRVAYAFNIYKECDPAEMKWAMPAIGRAKARVEALLEEWPGHDVLKYLLKLCNTVLNFPVATTPLMKVLTGVELLLKALHEWDKNAHKGVAVKEQLKELSDVVLRWRRLELLCWPHIFTTKKREWDAKAHRWWYDFYTLIHVAVFNDQKSEEAVVEEVFHLVNDFCMKCNYGEFEARLKVLKSIASELYIQNYVEKELPATDERRVLSKEARETIYNILLNGYHYYAQWLPTLQAEIETQMRPMKEEMANFIKIHRWDNANYYQLKDSTKKSHKIINKAIKKYDEVMVKSVKEALKKEQERQLGNAVASEAAEKEKPGQKRKRADEPDPAEGNINMQDVAQDLQQEKEWLESQTGGKPSILRTTTANTVDLNEMVAQIIERATELQNTTKSKNTKARAVKHLLTTLQELGVSHIVANTIGTTDTWQNACKQQHPTTVTHLSEAFSDAMRAGDSYYFRSFSYLQVMRQAAPTAHEDLNKAQVMKALALCENILLMLVKQRAQVTKAHTHLQQIQTLKDMVAALTHSQPAKKKEGNASKKTKTALTYPCQATKEFLLDLRAYVISIAEACEQGLLLLRGVTDICPTQSKIEAMSQELASLTATLQTSLKQINQLAGPYLQSPDAHVLFTGKDLESLASRVHQIKASCDKAVQLMQQPSVPAGLKRCIEGLVHRVDGVGFLSPEEMVTRYDALIGLIASSKAPMEPLTGLDKWTLSKYKTMLGLKPTTPKDSEAMISDTVTLLDKAIAEMNKASIPEKVDAFFKQMEGGVQCDTYTAMKLANKAKDMIPTLDNWSGHINSVIVGYSTFHRALARLLVVITRIFSNLYAKGFCGSEDNDDDDGGGEGEGEGAMNDGTGMGDGDSKGAKDVGEQMTHEEQVMTSEDQEKKEGEEQQENGQEKDDGKDDDGVEMENDFEGDKEDEPKLGEDEIEEEDEEDDPDDDMGSVHSENEEIQGRQGDKDKDDKEQTDKMKNADEIEQDDFSDGDEDKDDEDEEEGGENVDKNMDQQDAEMGEMPESNEMGLDEDMAMDDDDGDESQDEKPDGEEDGEDEKDEEKDGDEDGDEEGDKKEEEEEGEAENENKEVGDEDDKDEKDEGEDQSKEKQEEGDDQEGVDEDQDGDKEEDDKKDDAEDDKSADKKDTQQTMDNEANDDGEEGKDAVDAAQQPLDDANADNQQQQEQQTSDTGQTWKQTRNKESEQSNKQKDNKSKPPPNQQPMNDLLQNMKDWRQRLQKMNETVDSSKEAEQGEEDDDAQDEDLGGEQAFEYCDREEAKDPEKDKMGLGDVQEAPQESFIDRKEEAVEESKEKKEEEDVPEKKNEDDEDDPEKEDDKGELVKGKGKKKKQSEDGVIEPEDDSEPEAEEEVTEMETDEDKQKRGWRLWAECEAATATLAAQLCEHLRLILEPTLQDRLEGDFKTGKRINMKKVIPYIASGFKKDKIWLRRTKPSKRQYQVLMCVDDSLSMTNNNAGIISCQALALLCKALSQMEIGELCIAAFGKEMKVLHPLASPFTSESGALALADFTFQQTQTNVKVMLEQMLDYLDEERVRSLADVRAGGHQLLQINIIISDGRIVENRDEIRQHVTRAQKNWQLLVFVILDIEPEKGPAQGMYRSDSIMDMQMVKFNADGKMITETYMEDFPFPFYLVVRDIASLPDILSDSLRQWFELLALQL